MAELALDRIDAFVFARVVGRRRLLPQVALEQLDVVDEHLEGVVDLVREPDREFAERQQSVVLTQHANVLEEADAAEFAAAVVVDDGARDRHRHRGAGLVDQFGLEVLDQAGAVDRFVTHRAEHRTGVVDATVEPFDRTAEHFVGFVAERVLGAVVVEDDLALAVDRDDDVGRTLEQPLEVDFGKFFQSPNGDSRCGAKRPRSS